MGEIVIGFEEVRRKLRKLPIKIKDKVLRGSVRAAAKPIIKEARMRAPKRTGNLAKSIGVTPRRSKKPYEVVVSVSPRRAKKYNGWYGHFVEFGHPIVKGGKVVGHAPAKPFMRQAFEAKGEETIDAFNAYMRKRLDKELAKL